MAAQVAAPSWTLSRAQSLWVEGPMQEIVALRQPQAAGRPSRHRPTSRVTQERLIQGAVLRVMEEASEARHLQHDGQSPTIVQADNIVEVE